MPAELSMHFEMSMEPPHVSMLVASVSTSSCSATAITPQTAWVAGCAVALQRDPAMVVELDKRDLSLPQG